MLKCLSILTLLSIFLTIPLSSFAQEEEDIELYLPKPEGKLITGPDGQIYHAYTKEEQKQIDRSFRSYHLLSDFAIAAIFAIGDLEQTIEQLNQEVMDYEVQNELLLIELQKSRLLKNALEIKLTNNKRKSFFLTLGLSTLLGVSSGLIGVAVGQSF
jgi:hypothetical protein